MSNLYEKYKNEPGMLVAIAEEEGNINFLEEIFFKKKEISIFYVTPKENWNWLHQCNLNNYSPAPLSVVEFYIKNGVDINMQDMYGMTPLHYAMRAKNIDAAMALLNAGANPNVENQDKVIPLSMIGGIPQALDVIELMLKKGGNVHYFNGQFELIDGMKRYNGNKPEFKAVIELLEKYS